MFSLTQLKCITFLNLGILIKFFVRVSLNFSYRLLSQATTKGEKKKKKRTKKKEETDEEYSFGSVLASFSSHFVYSFSSLEKYFLLISSFLIVW